MNEATQKYVRQHADDDVRMLAFRGRNAPGVDLPLALQQIQGRQTARRKLPSWASVDGLLFPPHLALEQCSGEAAARYKARLIASLMAPAAPDASEPPAAPGESPAAPDASEPPAFSPCVSRSRGSRFIATTPSFLIDLTGGFGVDFSFLAPLFRKAVYVERQEELCALARNNLPLLGLPDATVVCTDAASYLQQAPHASLIFLDPARRDQHGGRTYALSDCTPDVLQLRDLLLRKADCVLLKLSPMLDWRKAVSDLGPAHVAEVHIVSVGGECKELLVLLTQEAPATRLVCANDEQVLALTIDRDAPTLFANGPIAPADKPFSFLYEPNASVMKAGCFAELCRRFAVSQLAPNSHLFVSDTLTDGFPGRSFRVTNVTSMNKKELRTALSGIRKANITVRNFPLTVAQLRQRLKMSEGGSDYLFATTLADGKHVLVLCQRMQND